MNACFRAGLLLALLVVPTARCLALGEEQFGNEPLTETNYAAWKGLAEVVNDKSRVYYNWINGNENCYYAGGIDQLNAVLKKFAAADLAEHEVVLRPDAGVAGSFDEAKKTSFNWHLQIFGGIAAHLTTLDKGDLVWPKHPRLTIHATGEFDLAKLEVPQGIKLLTSEDLGVRARQGIESKAQNVRGWSAGVVAQLDSHDPANLAAVAKLLADDNDWVRLNAAGSIGLFGQQAKSAIPALKNCLERPDESLKTAAKQAIETIESAPDRTEEAQAHAAGLKKIKEFIAANKPKP